MRGARSRAPPPLPRPGPPTAGAWSAGGRGHSARPPTPGPGSPRHQVRLAVHVKHGVQQGRGQPQAAQRRQHVGALLRALGVACVPHMHDHVLRAVGTHAGTRGRQPQPARTAAQERDSCRSPSGWQVGTGVAGTEGGGRPAATGPVPRTEGRWGTTAPATVLVNCPGGRRFRRSFGLVALLRNLPSRFKDSFFTNFNHSHWVLVHNLENEKAT